MASSSSSFIPWGSIGSINQVEKQLKVYFDLIKEQDTITLQYRAKVKLHGANASIVIHNTLVKLSYLYISSFSNSRGSDDGLKTTYQSRNKVLDPAASGRSGSCFGFANWVRQHEQFFTLAGEQWMKRRRIESNWDIFTSLTLSTRCRSI